MKNEGFGHNLQKLRLWGSHGSGLYPMKTSKLQTRQQGEISSSLSSYFGLSGRWKA